MAINQEFYDYIKPYLVKLSEQVGEGFVVFGSAPLYLLGVVPFVGRINDLDVVLLDEAVIPPDVQTVTFHHDPSQKLYKIYIDDLEVDMGVRWPGYEDFTDKIKSDPIVIDGFKFASLEVVEAWKWEMVERYDRQKDKDYLEKILEFKNNSSL